MSVTATDPAVTARLRDVWASGDYAVIGTTLQIVGELLAEAADVGWDDNVLDVAAGNGNATLAAARRGARVVSTDFVPSLLDRGARRAAAEGLDVTFDVADAEALPYADASFDVALSTFGVMFAANQAQAAAELVRVVRPGGRIGLASWTPDSLVGQVLATRARYVPAPAGTPSPTAWGDEETLRGLLGDAVETVDATERAFTFRYRSPRHFVETFRAWYGPLHTTFAALDDEAAKAFEQDLVALLESQNRGGADALVVPSRYLEAVVVRA